MADIQFEIRSDLTVLSQQHIETNFEEVKTWLANEIQPYATMAVTEDGISDAKKNLAKLRKLSESINKQKIAVKKEWMAPYTEYETQAKQLMAIVDEGISNINTQVKDFDNRRREEKISAIHEYFDSQLDGNELGDYLKWEDVFDTKWGNATVSQDSAEAAIDTRIDQTMADLQVIRGLGSQFETELLDEYAHTHSIREVMAKNMRLKMREEAERREKERRAAETFDEPENESGGFDANPAPTQAPQFIRPVEEEAPKPPKTYELRFQVVVTMHQAHALKEFFTAQGIEYHKIKEE